MLFPGAHGRLKSMQTTLRHPTVLSAIRPTTKQQIPLDSGSFYFSPSFLTPFQMYRVQLICDSLTSARRLHGHVHSCSTFYRSFRKQLYRCVYASHLFNVNPGPKVGNSHSYQWLLIPLLVPLSVVPGSPYDLLCDIPSRKYSWYDGQRLEIL